MTKFPSPIGESLFQIGKEKSILFTFNWFPSPIGDSLFQMRNKLRIPVRTLQDVSVPYRGIIISNPLPRIPLFKPAVVVICVGKLFLYIF